MKQLYINNNKLNINDINNTDNISININKIKKLGFETKILIN